MKVLFIIPVILGLSNCGASSNPFTHLTPKNQKQTFDTLLVSARAKYDSGEYEEALIDGEMAYKLHPKSQQAAETLGYIHLALAGIAPFDLAKKMIGSSPKKDSSKSEKSSDSSDDALSRISNVLSLTEEDLSKLGTLDKTDASLPIMVPICAGEARERIEPIAHVNRAIEVICPFVSPGAKINSEPRHQCEKSKINNLKSGKSNFLWAFAHLTEAIAFRKVLTYSTQKSGSKTNLEMRVDKIKSVKVDDPTQMDSFLKKMASLEATIAKIMPVDGKCSQNYPQTQFNALLNDLVSVNLAFANMPGVPEELTKSISKAMEKIEKIRNNTRSSNSNATNKALKGDLTKKIGDTLTAKINDISNSGKAISEEQKTKVCSTFKSITGDSKDKPDICK
ncbi:hypothetical protein MEO40_19275 [Dolichospermum sp. ST_sed1]|nr:hypothetical protein [Dolichospermum sp. ST_sed1]